MKILKRIVISLVILLTVVYCSAIWSLSSRVLIPQSSFEKTRTIIAKYWGTTYEEVMATMPTLQNFSIRTSDGIELSGKYFRKSATSTCAIIFPHGWGAMWADMLKYIPVFDACNCDYVLYDHRAHGESEGKFGTGGIREANDLLEITNYVSATYGYSLQNIGWMGSSWGAAAALMAGSQEKNIGFVIADSPFQDWNSAVFERAIMDYGAGIKLIAPGVMQVVNFRSGIDYRDASSLRSVSSIVAPVLLIHSRDDTRTASRQSVKINENLDPARSQFVHTEWGNDHVMDVVNNRAQFTRIVRDFLAREAPQFLTGK